MKLLSVFFISLLFCVCSFAKSAVTEKWPEMSLFHLDGQWKNHNNEDFTMKDFEGKVVIMTMVYTSCQHTCPIITSKVKKLQRSLPRKLRKKVLIAMVSFDPENDTPAALGKYKKSRKFSDQWIFLTGKDKGIRELAAVLGVSFKKGESGGFSHSNIISVLNKKGEVVDQVTSLDESTKGLTLKIKSLLK